MAKIKNITGDTLSLFRADAPPIQPGDVIAVRDENFVDRAWPTSTWELVEPPVLEGDLAQYADLSSDEAHLWAVPEAPADVDVKDKALVDMTVAELKDVIAAAGIETDATKKADLIAAIAAHNPED